MEDEFARPWLAASPGFEAVTATGMVVRNPHGCTTSGLTLLAKCETTVRTKTVDASSPPAPSSPGAGASSAGTSPGYTTVHNPKASPGPSESGASLDRKEMVSRSQNELMMR